MQVNQIPVAKKFNDVMTHILGPFIDGNSGKVLQGHLFSPSDLYHIISGCDPRTEFFKFETINEGCGEGSNEFSSTISTRIGRWGRHLFYSSKKNAGKSNTFRQRCRIGIRYSISQFTNFERATPASGLPIGKDEGRYWIRPLQAELLKTGISDGIFPLEIKSVFQLTFANGTTGQAGYIDRMSTSEKFRRFHLYDDGKQEPAETYSDQKRMHDLFRTLMGQILLGEMYPRLYQIFSPHIRHCEPDTGIKAHSDNLIRTDVNPDNVLPFILHKSHRTENSVESDPPRRICIL